jgi:hypothetical protein
VTRLWPPAEPAQVDYESLRDVVLATGSLPDTVVATRFRRDGLAALITAPVAEAVFVAAVVGARRPPWTPHVDPRLKTLADGYQLLLTSLAQTVRTEVAW